MTVGEYISQAQKRIEEAGLECADALQHSRHIVQAVLEISSADLIVRSDQQLGSDLLSKLESVLVRRLSGEPFQYIIGHAWFWNWKFAVGPGVLIPRPETERLVELALKLETRDAVRVAELGAGTGVIGMALLQERPMWEWHAWEINPASQVYLEQNLEMLPARSQYHWRLADFFGGVEQFAPYDWLIANPPYVKRSEIGNLSQEVRHEPFQALDGGTSGLEIVKKLIAVAPKILAPGGGLLLEIGSDQGNDVLKLLQAGEWVDARIEKDLAGLDRVAVARKG